MTKIEIVVRTVENETISNEKVVAELYGIENRIEINQSVLSYHHLNSIVSFLQKERYNIIVRVILSYCADLCLFPVEL